MREASGSRCDKWLAMSKTFKHNDGDVRIFKENSTGANPNEASHKKDLSHILCKSWQDDDTFERGIERENSFKTCTMQVFCCPEANKP